MKHRIEKDSMGDIQVPDDKYWGAQTQRSLENFKISYETMPQEIIYAFAYLKKACVIVNHKLDKISQEKRDAISQACDDILDAKLEGNFPLVVWQTGSGTQSNMNMNEVIANRASEILGDDFRVTKSIHPNDDVNMGQSSNDTYPTAMRIASILEIEQTLMPSLEILKNTLELKSKEFQDIIKIGRTHLQDATPLSLGQEFSGYYAMLKSSAKQIADASKHNTNLAIGATAVGTGINSHPDFSQMVSDVLNDICPNKVYDFVPQENKFHALTSHDSEVMLSGSLKALASNMMKIANDIRWLSSGPRCGIGELEIPENEPGSSIMPGKVNPTQSEAMTMVAVQVMGNDTAIGIASSQGNFELNVFKPVIAYNLLQSIRLLGHAMLSFNDNCAKGIKANIKTLDHNLNNSLMLVTALNPHIGYDNSAKIAKTAHKNKTSLKEEAIKSGLLSEEEFDKYIVPEDMISPHY